MRTTIAVHSPAKMPNIFLSGWHGPNIDKRGQMGLLDTKVHVDANITCFLHPVRESEFEKERSKTTLILPIGQG